MLSAVDLLELVQSSRAMEAMWRQSRLSSQVWRRDLQPAVQRYAEYVQLMPASESHHHAHVGGLLAHTLEMTL
ncbi:MAG: TraI domain-containing protein, partial [Gammaproteobacteria bacterium]|nr:TraI domain-containing protein [Gammaproteobacteria bacterium]